MDYARAIRIARAARGVERQELAVRAGIGTEELALLEGGGEAHLAALAEIASALNIGLLSLIALGTTVEDFECMDDNLRNELALHALAAIVNR